MYTVRIHTYFMGIINWRIRKICLRKTCTFQKEAFRGKKTQKVKQLPKEMRLGGQVNVGQEWGTEGWSSRLECQ